MEILKRSLQDGRTGFYVAVMTEVDPGASSALERIARAEEDLTITGVVNLHSWDAKDELLLRTTRSTNRAGCWMNASRNWLRQPDV
jgi:ribosomal protein S6